MTELAESPLLNLGLILGWILLTGVVAYKYRYRETPKSRLVIVTALAAGWIAFSLHEVNVILKMPQLLVDGLFFAGGGLLFAGSVYSAWLRWSEDG